METQFTKPEWLALSKALSDMRDSLTRMSLFLSDRLAEMPSPERNVVQKEVERLLTQIFDSERRTHG
jgi:hypothetical protein